MDRERLPGSPRPAGLDDNNKYRLADIFVSRFKGKTEEGRLLADLEPTGERPTFRPRTLRTGDERADPVDAGVWEKGEGVGFAEAWEANGVRSTADCVRRMGRRRQACASANVGGS